MNHTRPSRITATCWHRAATSVVLWVESSTVPRRAVPGEQGAQLEALLGVEPGGGLVEQQQLGLAEQGGRQGDPLPHAARQGPDLLVHPVGQADGLQHPGALASSPPAVGVLLEDRDVVDELEGREGAVELGRLGQVAEPTADLDALVGDRGVAAEQPQRALVGGQHGAEHAEQRGLARPVGPEQADDSVPDLQVDAGRRPGVRPKRLARPVVSMVVTVSRCAVLVMRSSDRRCARGARRSGPGPSGRRPGR